MWEKIKGILKILFYPLLLVAGFLIGRNLTGGDGNDRQSAHDRAQRELEDARSSAAGVGQQLDRLAGQLGQLREDGRAGAGELDKALNDALGCTEGLRRLSDQIGRAGEAGAKCQDILAEYNRLADRSVTLIDELLRRYGSPAERTEDTEHHMDGSDGGGISSGRGGAGD